MWPLIKWCDFRENMRWLKPFFASSILQFYVLIKPLHDIAGVNDSLCCNKKYYAICCHQNMLNIPNIMIIFCMLVASALLMQLLLSLKVSKSHEYHSSIYIRFACFGNHWIVRCNSHLFRKLKMYFNTITVHKVFNRMRKSRGKNQTNILESKN